MNTLMHEIIYGFGSENGLSVKGFVYILEPAGADSRGITIRLADSGAGSYMKWTLRS